jgi:hypothetical protein
MQLANDGRCLCTTRAVDAMQLCTSAPASQRTHKLFLRIELQPPSCLPALRRPEECEYWRDMFSIHRSVSDPKFIQRFFVHQLVIVSAVYAMMTAVQYQVIGPGRPQGSLVQSAVATSVRSSGATRQTESVEKQSQLVAVFPDGWRRTAQGWQHTSEWQTEGYSAIPAARSMRAILLAERNRERSLIEQSIDEFRSISPIIIAVWQVTLVGCIWILVPRRSLSKASTESAGNR